MGPEKRSKAVDLSHHLSELSKARELSPLKGLQKYFVPGTLSLAGGLPSPAYFPLADITVNALIPDSFDLVPAQRAPSSLSWFWKLFGAGTAKERTSSITIPKYPAAQGDVNLETSLQYGAAVAEGHLQEFLRHFVDEVYQPAIEDYTVLISTGNTDGWNRSVLMLCNPGEGVLCDEWTYPSAISSMLPANIRPVPIAMDGLGMRADDLERVLSTWDADARQMPRPHVMYIVPVGQNPTGSTMSIERKKQIYDICCRYDVVIVEDDPYYFLQMSNYIPKHKRSPERAGDAKHFLASLSPSFLKIDSEGRVIRLDTFSKTIAPGSRLGWFTCNPFFAERLERQGETSTQAPCGFGQSIITKILLNWTYDGYVRWLRGLRTEYTQRRDFIIDCFSEEFQIQIGPSTTDMWSGCTTYHAARKQAGRDHEKYPLQNRTMFSFVPPVAGMFIWIKLHLDQHPSYVPGSEDSLEMKVFARLAESGVLFAPGWIFSAAAMGGSTKEIPGHFRLSFSLAESSDLERAVKIFGRVLQEFFVEQF
ncbi:pyridoxal phosphate-dependent transferase [Melanogaster broomeanus]|nr:pyridoxal phosphate-dependent transferase [Melanogaster broomeanus]